METEKEKLKRLIDKIIADAIDVGECNGDHEINILKSNHLKLFQYINKLKIGL